MQYFDYYIAAHAVSKLLDFTWNSDRGVVIPTTFCKPMCKIIYCNISTKDVSLIEFALNTLATTGTSELHLFSCGA